MLFRHPVFRFAAVFGLLTGLYFAFTVTDGFASILQPYLRLNAQLSAAILSLLGSEATSDLTVIVSPQLSLRIARGCDAIDPSAIFVAAVFAFPVSARLKLPAALAGTLFLMTLNLARIVSLYYAGIHFPNAFDFLHHDVWQALFIFLALLIWSVWASWAAGRSIEPAHGAA